jgi:hypothetical protein
MNRNIEVGAMAGMTRKQVRITNEVANTLINKHHMCLDCAISAAAAFVWGKLRPSRCKLCSEDCNDAMIEFLTGQRTMMRVNPEELPSMH